MMLNLKIIGLVFLCILVSSDARRKNSRNVSITVQGTLLLNVPKNIPEPNFVVIQIKVSNQEPNFETRVHWGQCKSGKCRYVVRHINGNVGQRFAVGVSLYYNADGDHAGSPTKLAWSKEIGEIKAEGTTQHIKYDADEQYPRVALIDSLDNKTSGSLDGPFEHVPADPVAEKASDTDHQPLPVTSNTGEKISVTVEGTVIVDLAGNPEPDHLIVYLKLNGEHEQYSNAKRVQWSLCPNHKCPYAMRPVTGHAGQTYALGAMLYYKKSPWSTPKIEWSKEIAVLKAGENKQDAEFDSKLPNVTLLNVSNDTTHQPIPEKANDTAHQPLPVTSNTSEKVSVTVEGSVIVDLAGNPEPDHLIVYLKLNGEHEQYSNAKRVQWSLCPDRKCPYAMRPVTGHAGQTYALGAMLYYKKSPWNTPKIIWSKEIAVLKAGENKQDAEFDSKLVTLLNVSNDITHQTVSVPITHQHQVTEKESLSTRNRNVHESYSSQRQYSQSVTVSRSTGRAIEVDIGITLHINLPNNHLLMPNTVAIKLKLDGERTQPGMIRRAYNYVKRIVTGRGADYETIARWDHCHGNKCRYTVRKVHGYVDQSYAVGVKLNYKGKARGYQNDFVYSTEAAVLKEGKNEIELMYDASRPSVTLLNSNNTAANPQTQSQPSNTIANKSTQVPSDSGNRNVNKTKGKVTIQGTIHLELPLSKMQKPDDFIIYVETDEKEVYLLQIGSDCTNNMCQYSIPDVSAHVGQKYNLGMSLFYSAFSKNFGKAYKIAWLKEMQVSKDGENKLDIKYDATTITTLN